MRKVWSPFIRIYRKIHLINPTNISGTAIWYIVFFFTLAFFSNWRIIALHYFVGFCHISTWISHKYAYVPCPLLLDSLSHLPLHPTPLSCHRAMGWAVSHSKFPLATYFIYSNVHVSMLFSQFIPPSLSPTVSISLFSRFASPLLPCKYVPQYHLSRFCTHVNIHLCLSDLLHSNRP